MSTEAQSLDAFIDELDKLDAAGDEPEYTGPWTVAIFLVDRAYGGPEEGGWYYDCGTPAPEYAQHIRGFADLAEARLYLDSLDPVIAEANEGRRPISSVLSEGQYEAQICEGLPAPYPATRPHYE